ncbi:homeobox-leucine zipper protein HAT5 isoform X1 [Cucurbita moschata]|uniref:Homeobox-leucine zipper protein n=1 Tax=Cucurbita moschata TaxID=3662 RepID=A0A6J1EQW9_CUCMO|nr:homeobox-leucine zipper protein HAT5 isoform X1 [Cucurbita moschata]
MESGRFLFNPPAYGGNMLCLGGAGGSDRFLREGRTMMSMSMNMSMQESPKGRPFFRSPDDLYDDEYYDELYPEKKRRLANEQVQMLEKSFEEENKLEPERKSQLAKKLGLQPRQVAVWFQNRRARWKTKQLERDYDVLKASYDLLMSNYDSIVKENAVLKSEVASLTEKCVAKELDGGEAPIPRTTLEPLLADTAHVSAPHSGGSGRKAEDRLSSGSDSSAVIDDNCLQLIDSGDSYFPSNEYPQRAPLPPGLQMEHDDRNDNSNYLFSDMFAETNQQNQEGGPPAWWAWP